MTKFIAILLLSIMPLQLFADELPTITPIQKNQRAPYSGVLYNATAVAETIAQREARLSQHKLNIDLLKEQLKIQCDLQLDNLSAELDSCEDQYSEMLAIKDMQIGKLQELVLDAPNEHSHWWFGGGVLVGMLTTVGVVYALK